MIRTERGIPALLAGGTLALGALAPVVSPIPTGPTPPTVLYTEEVKHVEVEPARPRILTRDGVHPAGSQFDYCA